MGISDVICDVISQVFTKYWRYRIRGPWAEVIIRSTEYYEKVAHCTRTQTQKLEALCVLRTSVCQTSFHNLHSYLYSSIWTVGQVYLNRPLWIPRFWSLSHCRSLHRPPLTSPSLFLAFWLQTQVKSRDHVIECQKLSKIFLLSKWSIVETLLSF